MKLLKKLVCFVWGHRAIYEWFDGDFRPKKVCATCGKALETKRPFSF